MNRIIPAVCLVALLLAGCNTFPEATSHSRNYGAASEVAVTRHKQYSLQDQGVFSGQLTSAPTTLLTANSDRLSFDWEGDAIELLNELARIRGMQFNYSGVRLPLPVNLHVRDMTFSNALRLIKAQTAWRANIHQYPGLLQVSFMPPETRKKMKVLIPLMLSAILLTGCVANTVVSPQNVNAPPPDINAWLNPMNEKPEGISETRWKMLTDAGRTLGFRGGKARRSWELIQALNSRESTLNALYDFRPLISPEGWLPPVIDEAQDVAHITPDQIRTSSHVWTIIRPERFVSNPPGWRDWLLKGLSTTATPGTEGSVVPEDRTQRKVWEMALRQGWQEGRQNADLTLEANQKRLTRDFRGMMLYSLLWRQGMITRPDVTDQLQTITGNGQKLVTGDRVRRLKNHAEFNLQKSHWRPLITTERTNKNAQTP